MTALLRLVPAQQVLFGTGYAFVHTTASIRELSSLELSSIDRTATERGNSEVLMPRVKALAQWTPHRCIFICHL